MHIDLQAPGQEEAGPSETNGGVLLRGHGKGGGEGSRSIRGALWLDAPTRNISTTGR